MPKRLIIILILWTPLILSAASITGRVVDFDTGTALPGANILLEPVNKGTVADHRGEFSIDNLETGTYQLHVSYIGYNDYSEEIALSGQEPARLRIELIPSVIQMEQLVVTASRQPEPLSAAAASIGILQSRDIQRRGALRIDDALVNVPGVAIVGENVNIRGGSGYNRLGGHRHLVLLDNVPIMTSDLGSANWNILPITEIDHVEVLKGAASSIYGSGSISGVINILTRPPSQDPQFSIRQNMGLYDDPSVPEWKWTDKPRYYHRTDASYSQSVGPVGLRLAVSQHRSTGDRQNGFFQRWYITGKSRWSISDRTIFTLFSTYSHEDRELFLQWKEQNEALKVPPTDLDNRFSLSGNVSYATLEHEFNSRLSLKTRISYNQQLVGMPFNITNAFTPAMGFGGEMLFNWVPHPDHRITAGMDYKHDRVKSDYYGERRANGVSPFIQDVWHVSELWHLNAGLRLDTYTLVGDSIEWQLNPKIGFSYQPVFGTILHASIGKAFRAATVVERFISAGSKDFRALPNPGLKPERSLLMDVGIRQRFGEYAYLEATGFISQFENLIEPTLSPNLTAQFTNYPAARILGIEGQFNWQISPRFFHLQASATWMDPREVESNRVMLYRPRLIGQISPTLIWKGITLEADYRYMNRLDRVAVYPLDERVAMHYLELRLNSTYKNWLFQVMLRNALNYNYTVSERVLGEIRNFAFSVKYEL